MLPVLERANIIMAVFDDEDFKLCERCKHMVEKCAFMGTSSLDEDPRHSCCEPHPLLICEDHRSSFASLEGKM